MKTTFEFEVNTDAFLVDPDWEVFADQHDHRYGLAIKHFKGLVKGDAYDNEVMKLRVGRHGFYVQSQEVSGSLLRRHRPTRNRLRQRGRSPLGRVGGGGPLSIG